MLLNDTPADTGRAIGSPPALQAARTNPAATAVLIAIAFLAPFLLYFDTAKSIVAIWNSSETFAHGYIILPITLWLIWRRRSNFVVMPPSPFWPALILLALAGFGWLLARMGEVQVVMQYAFVSMIPIIALAIFGRRLAWSLAFPLLFLLMAVPFGEVFIDPLISFTADFTVWALQATGIPVLRNGNRFEIPTGSWSVVEACSGVRYLISSITLGWLFAYLTYSSTKRRALFMLAAVLVPILANWLRAYMIVMIGHLSGMELAVGVDHLIYGWAFFGLVMFLMFWVGSFWREDEPPLAATAHPGNTAGAPGSLAASVSGAASAHAPGFVPASAPAFTPVSAMLTAVLATVAVTAIWPLFAEFNDRATFNAQPVRLAPAQTTWTSAPAFSEWTPRFAPADGVSSQVLRDPARADGKPVALSVLYYRNQRNGKALISSTNRLVDEEGALHVVGQSARTESIGGRSLALREATIQGPGGTILVWSWYWIDSRFTASNYGGKLLQAKAKLLFHGDDGAAVLLSAPYTADPEQARSAMRSFLGANLPAIEATLTATKGG